MYARGNPSKLSLEERDKLTELDEGDIDQWSTEMVQLKEKWGMRMFGGCCGTDSKHIVAIADKIYEKK